MLLSNSGKNRTRTSRLDFEVTQHDCTYPPAAVAVVALEPVAEPALAPEPEPPLVVEPPPGVAPEPESSKAAAIGPAGAAAPQRAERPAADSSGLATAFKNRKTNT